MTWQLVQTVKSENLITPVTISRSFNDSLIIVEAICNNAKPKWHEAGWLRQVKTVPDVGVTKSSLKKIYLQRQEVRFEALTSLPYSLEFIAREWIPDITLKVWENDSPVYPVNPPGVITPFQATKSTVSTVQVTTTPRKILSANSNRKLATIFNQDASKIIYLDIVNTVTSSNAAFTIQPGLSLILGYEWTGDIYAVIKTGSHNLTVREFS